MKKIDNIEQFDDLLKQQFDSFAPEPPIEVWQNLSQNPAIGNTSATSKFVSNVKSLSFVSKGIITLVVIVGATVSVILLKEDKPRLTSNILIITPLKVEEKNIIENKLKAFEENSVSASVSNADSDRKVQEEKQINEKDKNANIENNLAQKSSSIENQELRTEIKPILIETPQGQTQVEKSIVKAPINESISIRESETNNQPSRTITLADVDTLMVPEIPNTFTPGDDDNFNKEFIIKIENENTYRLRVFDTRANLVFESFKKEMHWNGQHIKSGENCESGKYFYIFDYQYKGAKELLQKSGYLYLTR